MKVFGNAPVNRTLFLTGKISLFLTWISLFFKEKFVLWNNSFLVIIALVFFMLGIILSIFSFINIGNSNSFGLPTEKTKLKVLGIYKISRNPMYIAFFLLSLSAMVYTLNPLIIALGIYAIFVHHKIVLAEEKFLEKRFGKVYVEYKKRIRRYL